MSGQKSSTLAGIRQLHGDDAGMVEIRYYRLVKEQNTGEGNIYGIRIENHNVASTPSVLGERFEEFLTEDGEQVDKIIDKLIGNSVTALTASEVIDLLYDETLHITEVLP